MCLAVRYCVYSNQHMKTAIQYFDRLCGMLTPALALVYTANRFGLDREQLRNAIVAQRIIEATK